MSLLLVALSKHIARLKDDGVRIRVIGDLASVNERVRGALEDAQRATEVNSRLTLTVAFNYGGRWDVVQACRKAIVMGLAPEQLDEQRLSSLMATAETPDPDLFIRTGGEVRLSNFLLWQSAYAEFHFTDCLWPDFDERELDRALAVYTQRERRFGDVGTSGQGEGALGMNESPARGGA